MNQSHKNSPIPRSEEHMLGHGFYKHSHAQGEANAYGLPLIIEGINQIDLQQVGTEVRIADFGSAQGQNSLCRSRPRLQVKALLTKAGRTSAQDPKKYSCHWVFHLMLISTKQKVRLLRGRSQE